MLTSVRACLALLSAVITTAVIAPPEASAQGRHALLIANFGYQPGVGELRNPKRDVDLIASALRQVGFSPDTIRQEQNLTTAAMREVVRAHVARLKAAGPDSVGFFYYSGHGAAAPAGSQATRRGSNYLIPTDLDTTRRPDFWEKAMPLEEIGKLLEEASEASHIVVFDACRSELVLPERDVTKGFVPIANSEYVGMLFAFASAPNQPASDGLGQKDNGPYAVALAEELVKPGIDHLHLFANVRTHVANATQRSQIPWIRDGFLTLTYLAPRPSQPQQPIKVGGDHVCLPAVAAPKLSAIVWSPLPDRSRLVFKRPTQTYVDARTDASFLEQVDKDDVHRPAKDTAIEVGRIDGRDAWYRYVRDRGAPLKRHITVDDAVPR